MLPGPGRPKGSKNKKTLMREAIDKIGPHVTSAIEAAIMNPDSKDHMQAVLAALARMEPPLKAGAQKVTFELDKSLPLHEQAQQIMDAIAAGDVDPETGQALIATLDKIGNLKTVEELEARIIALEGKA